MKVAFLYNNIFRDSNYGEKHPVTLNRVSNVFDIAKIINFEKVNYYNSEIASMSDLCMFHEKKYLEILKKTELTQKITPLNSKKYNLGTVSNPLFKEMYRRHAAATGSLLMAADLIANGKYNLIFSPGSGAHHGQKNRASGFCYLNDIATCIIYLKKIGMKKILYFDMDAHYGDGVVESFRNDKSVLTVSIHQKNLWPKSGHYILEDSIINIPVDAGFNDYDFKKLVEGKLLNYLSNFKPDVVLMQMGADSLKDDYMSKLLLSNNAMSFVIKLFKSLSKNIIVMGGGGYNPWVTLRAWIYNLATLSGEEEKLNLNLSAKFFLNNIIWKKKPEQKWIQEIIDRPNIFDTQV